MPSGSQRPIVMSGGGMDVGKREDALLDRLSVLTHRRDRALAIVRDPDLAPDLRDLASAVELALTT